MFEKRLTVFLFLLIAMTLALVARAFTIQVVHKDYWVAEASDSLRRYDPLPSRRGRILDRNGVVLAMDQPCIDACVAYPAVQADPPAEWLKSVAVGRLRARSNAYEDASKSRRKTLAADEIVRVKQDLDQMWATLAKAGNKTPDEIDELRRDIVRRVETRRRIAWYRKFEKAVAAFEQRPPAPWYKQWLLDESGPGPKMEDFDIHVADESDSHVILADIDYSLRNALQARIENYPGLLLRTSVVRVYPHGNAACQLIGHLGKVTQEDLAADADQKDDSREYEPSDLIGRTGLESMLESKLRGSRGRRESSRQGAEVRRTDPVFGPDVTTTIDIELQTRIEAAFETVKFVPDRSMPAEILAMPGAAVVIDIKSGEVRALASYPTYNLNKFDELYDALATDYVNRPMMNRATTFALEPGSTVKPMVGLGAITQGRVAVDEGIVCNGYLVIDGVTKKKGRCWTMAGFKLTHMQMASPPASPALTFSDALERSCNVYFETLGDRLGIAGLSYWFDQFGLGRPTGVGIAESSGRIPNDYAGPMSQARQVSWGCAMGQDQVAATPMQMANVAATLGRNGVWVRPTLVPRPPLVEQRAAATSPTNPWPDRVDLHLSPDGLRAARLGMINVVNGGAGTGSAAASTEYIVAGKTGSATSAPFKIARRDAHGKLLRDEKGRVINDTITLGTVGTPNPNAPWYRAIGVEQAKAASHAWFIGYAPANDPKIAFAVLVEYGGGGGPAAGGVAKAIVEECAKRGYLD